MIIQLTPDEMRDYQKACAVWADKAGAALDSFHREIAECEAAHHMPRVSLIEMCEEYLKDNPMPTLIPKL